jgi:peroxiredoxin/predicted 2-oxoglutarate/Fe(II)-dependent dioxygenase YbiX
VSDRQPFLSRGDRAENFCLPALDGRLWAFYEGVRGFRNVLLFCEKNSDENRKILAEFAEIYEQLQGLKVDVFAVSTETVDANVQVAAAVSLPFTLLADADNEVVGAYSRMLGAQVQGPMCLLLDENQRILEWFAPLSGTIGEDNRTLAERTIAFFRAEASDENVLVLEKVAPVLVVPNVLNGLSCNELIDRWENLGHKEGVVHSRLDDAEGTYADYSVKKRQDHIVSDEVLHNRLSAVIGRRIAPELYKAFYLKRFRFSRFIIACYDAEKGGYFRPHRDNSAPQTRDRVFALTLNLNNGYDGGGVRFPEYGPSLYKPTAGGAILFSCSHLHEAMPVTKGRRFVLINQLRDPDGSVVGQD